MTKILFLHGRGSVPGGLKPTWLRRQGHEVFNPGLDDNDFAAAVQTAQREFDLHRPDVIVGSSRGGAVALNLLSGQTPLVLLCPAWRYWGSARSLQAPALILHSRHDAIVPFADSEELLRASHQPGDCLLAIGEDHRLADPESLAVLDWACRTAGSGRQLPWMDGFASETADHEAIEATAEASYLCNSCGEMIVIPVDLSEGASQTFVEDCPVCCRPSLIHVEQHEQGGLRVFAEAAQD